MKQKSKICFEDVHFIILDEKEPDVESFLEKTIWSLLKISKHTVTLSDPDVSFMKFKMKT